MNESRKGWRFILLSDLAFDLIGPCEVNHNGGLYLIAPHHTAALNQHLNKNDNELKFGIESLDSKIQ